MNLNNNSSFKKLDKQMKRMTVLSLEQALSLPYATERFVQLGWRVIRIESTGGDLPGDPNRYIGATVVDGDRRSYYIAPNVGKEAIALNLKTARGQEILRQLISDLDVDIFCCNTLPSRYRDLGVDYETLMSVKPDLIWAVISAMGSEYPEVPGYDPAIQAMAGYMELTGIDEPTLSGIPLIDLKAGDEVYANVLLALLKRAQTGRGEAIHVSMLQAAVSWLTTTLPLLDFDCDPSEVTRCGNEHRKFIPVNVYPTCDGYIFVAIGNDLQWKRLVEILPFGNLAQAGRLTNAGRHQEREKIHQELAEVTRGLPTQELMRLFSEHKIPHAPIQTIAQVRAMEAVHKKLTTTRLPNGKIVHLPPLAVDLAQAPSEFGFAPKYNQHTVEILGEIGITNGERKALMDQGIIPKPL